jgi:type VI secretion system protein ImpE
VPLEKIERVAFHAPSVPRDLLWRRAQLTCRGGGPDVEVCVPVLYAGAHSEADDTLRLGRMTDWRGGDGVPVRGVGQRTFLVGTADRSVLEIKEITIDNPPA